MHSLPKKDEIKVVHIEATSKCNLTCPQCARSPSGFLNPLLPMDELTIDDYIRIFDSEFCKQLNQVYFNGNYGDPAASSCLPEALHWLKINGVKKVNFFTNGSLRNPEWWTRIAGILNAKTDFVVFSIDGLEDTNHIYRRGSNWSKIMENAKAFIAAGGRARWDFLKFEHNEHQVEEARALAKSMGFNEFLAKDTVRFLDEGAGKIKKEQTINFHRRGRKDIVSMAVDNKLKIHSENKTAARLDTVLEKYGTFDNYVNTNEISCKSTEAGGYAGANVFIDFMGKVWPCCWLGCIPYMVDEGYPPKEQWKQMIEKYGIDFNNTRVHTLEEILNHQWYTTDLPNSWNNDTTHETNPRLQVCGKTCGTEFEWSSGASSKNVERHKL